MKRRVAGSLAVMAAGAGLAFAQVRPGSVLVTEEPVVPRTVIRVNGSSQPARPPQPAPKLPAPKSGKLTQVQAVDGQPKLEPPADPGDKPAVPPAGKEPAAPKPMPPARAEPIVPPVTPVTPVTPAPAPVAPPPAPAIPAEPSGPGGIPGYATRFVEPAFPHLNKCDRRLCGTVYVDTPYFWLDTRYTYSWINSSSTVPLITAGAFNAAQPGALGDPGTRVLFDGQNLTENPFFGGRFLAGGWFDECQYYGAEFGYFFLGARERQFIAAADGRPGLDGLFVPFFNTQTGTEDAFAVATSPPNQAAGRVIVTSRTRLQGAEGHGLFSFARGLTFRTDALIGVRWLGLDDDLIVEQLIDQEPFGAINVPASTYITDAFSSRSDFIGLDLGFKTHWQSAKWSVDGYARVALGGNHLRQANNSFTTLSAPGFSATFDQLGRLINQPNQGEFTKDVFSVVPEVGLSIAYQPTNWYRFTVGYSWTYWTNVLRAGDQVDRVINPQSVPTLPQYTPGIVEPQRPAVLMTTSDLWLQSLSLGMEFLF